MNKDVNKMNRDELEEAILFEDEIYRRFDEQKFLNHGYTEAEMRNKIIDWILESPDC